MSTIGHEKYCRIEANVRYATSQIRPLCNKEMQDDIVTAQYVLSVVRQHAASAELPMSEEERDESLRDLFAALYR